MDILQEIYYMWDEKYSLITLKNDKEWKKRSGELEYLRKEFFKKIDTVVDAKDKKEFKKAFDDIVDAELSVSEEEQNIYFVEGFKEGVKFILSCFS
ncbi:MAG: hypothetical protein SO148_01035 [Candidatus Onthovivens sp.]|nr:hypothetical protein [Candidatus Onthovivens sp.]